MPEPVGAFVETLEKWLDANTRHEPALLRLGNGATGPRLGDRVYLDRSCSGFRVIMAVDIPGTDAPDPFGGPRPSLVGFVCSSDNPAGMVWVRVAKPVTLPEGVEILSMIDEVKAAAPAGVQRAFVPDVTFEKNTEASWHRFGIG